MASIKEVLSLAKLTHAQANRIIVMLGIFIFASLYYSSQSNATIRAIEENARLINTNNSQAKRITELETTLMKFIWENNEERKQNSRQKDSSNLALTKAVLKLSK